MLQFLTSTLQDCIRDPREAVARFVARGLSVGELILLGTTMVILSTLTTQTALLIGSNSLGARADTFVAFLERNPLIWLAFYLTIYAISIPIARRVSGMFGGTATAYQTVAALSFFQVLVFLTNAAESVLLVLLPPFAGLAALIALGWLFYVLATFIDTLNGFDNLIGVAMGIIITGVACAFAVTFVLTLLSTIV